MKQLVTTLFTLTTFCLLVLPAQAQTCLDDQFGGNAQCVSNDSEGFLIEVTNVDETCNQGTVGQAQVDLEVTYGIGNAQERYDLGVFVAQDGGDGLTGDCFRQFAVSGDVGAENLDDDACWDKGTLSSATGVVINLSNVTVTCPAEGDVVVNVCVGWGNQEDQIDNDDNDTCDNLDDLQAGTPSHCVCGGANLGSLPVELVSFGAVLEGSNVVLNWETASEGDNAGFAIEHSDNGAPFEEVSFVPGAGNSLRAISYTYTINDISVGTHQFRLKQVDFDGAFTYSTVVEVTSEVPGTHALSDAYPNPFNPSTSFSLAVSREQNVAIDIYDTLGRHISQLYRGTMEANVARTFTVNAANWTSGSYTVVVEGATFRDSRSLVLLK